jgi:2-polyprenyl-3-methyl-5-hydroxy-6-metoxy-1,4-benzoquinol methylase
MSFCERDGKFFCIACAPEHRVSRRPFWGWRYSYRLRCPWRAEWHAGLDRLEFDGRHPWQTRPGWSRARTGLDPARTVPPRWSFRIVPANRILDADVRQGWDRAAPWWVARYTDRGDPFREWILDPLLFEWLGQVRGLRILDAGCGGGYLSRLLAGRGARVTGVDVSSGLLAYARAEETRESLGVRYARADLADLSRFRTGSFDIVVANVVLVDVRRYRAAIAELYRVLAPGGRFVFSLTHPSFEVPAPGMWVREPEDSERIEDRRFLRVDRYFDRVGLYWGPPGVSGVPGFHRPLRDYLDAVFAAGFLVSKYEEPTATTESLRRHHHVFADLLRVPLFVVVEAVKPRGRRPVRSAGHTAGRTPRAPG